MKTINWTVVALGAVALWSAEARAQTCTFLSHGFPGTKGQTYQVNVTNHGTAPPTTNHVYLDQWFPPLFNPNPSVNAYATQAQALLADMYFWGRISEYIPLASGDLKKSISSNFTAPSKPSRDNIRAHISSQITAANFPTDTSGIYVVRISSNTSTDPPPGGGYHDTMVSPNGSILRFAVVNGGNMIVLDHEVSEAATDGLPNQWYDSQAGLGGEGEVGDLCNGLRTHLPKSSIVHEKVWSQRRCKCLELSTIALTGPTSWNTLPVAMSNGDGFFHMNNKPAPFFAANAGWPDVHVLAGDFNGDGLQDYALIGHAGWTSIIVELANDDGTFTHENQQVLNFPAWAAQASGLPGGGAVVGDFNGDGKDDIALTGVSTWTDIRVALSASAFGDFIPKQMSNPWFAATAAQAGAVPIAGDFNGDGFADIALTGGPWTSIPVAFTNADFTSRPTNAQEPFIAFTANDAQLDGVLQVVAGDFNGDGRSDFALTGGFWTSIPVAFSSGDANGTFTHTNANVDSFPSLATHQRSDGTKARALAGDFNGDGFGDIALTGPSDWLSIPLALSNGDGTFRFVNQNTPDFAGLAATRGAVAVGGSSRSY